MSIRFLKHDPFKSLHEVIEIHKEENQHLNNIIRELNRRLRKIAFKEIAVGKSICVNREVQELLEEIAWPDDEGDDV